MVARALWRPLLVGITCYLASAAVSAEECATVEQQGWAVSEGQCEVGRGLWGRKPASEEGRFWVQCGLLSKMPSPSFANALKNATEGAGLLLSKESQGLRCLVGPFSDYPQALAQRDNIRKLPALNQAFIREVVAGQFNTAQFKATQPQSTQTKATPSKPIRVASAQPAARKATKSNRPFFDVAGVISPTPKHGEAHFSTPTHIWWRATLAEAETACEQAGKALIGKDRLKQLLNDDAKRAELPNRLPFWVAERAAFDAVMKVTMPLSEESALMVLCE